MNIFNSIQHYAGKWGLTNSRKFSDEEKSAVSSASVVSSQYGMSVCFMLVGGEQAFIPLSSDSKGAVGDSVNLDNAELLTLSRAGENDIQRVKIY